MGLTLAKGEDPQKLRKQIAIIQSRFKVQVDEKEKISAVMNAEGLRYADAIGQVQRLCKMKSEPVTARKLIKANHENFRLKDGESCFQDAEARKVETVLSASEAKKCYHCGETGHMAFNSFGVNCFKTAFLSIKTMG